MKRSFPSVLIGLTLASGCAGPGQPGRTGAWSAATEAPREAEPITDAAPATHADLDWSRLEAAVVEAARDQHRRLPAEKVRAAAQAYALDINRTSAHHLKQYHLDRAAVVLERDVFSGVTLAEGASLRGTVSGGSGGGGSRFGSSRGNGRQIGRTSGGSTGSSTSRSTGGLSGTGSQ